MMWVCASAVCGAVVIGTLAVQPPEPAPCASAERQRLRRLDGTWAVASHFRLQASPPKWEDTAGSSVIRFVLPGCALTEQLTSQRQERSLTVVGIYAYDAMTKQYQWVTADSDHGRLTLFEGGWTDRALTLESRLDLAGRQIRERRTISFESDDEFTVRSDRSEDHEANWDTTWLLRYSRVRP